MAQSESHKSSLLEQVKERSLAEGSVATRLRFDQIIAGSVDPWHREMVTVLRDHWWSEVVGDLETTMATLTPDPIYRSYGSKAFGPPLDVNTTEQAREMYRSLYDAGYFPGGVLDDLKIAAADWGLMVEMTLTTVLPGAVFTVQGMRIDPQRPYQVTHQMAEAHPFDRPSGLMRGEILYMGDPIALFPARR